MAYANATRTVTCITCSFILYRCPLITDPAKSLYLATGFVYDETASSETESVSFTPALEIIAFTGSDMLHIRAQYAPCNDDVDPKCFDIGVSMKTHTYDYNVFPDPFAESIVRYV